MKVWFFKDRWKSSSGWKNIFYAVIAQGCHMTDGRNLAEAIYMAHDLIACLKDDDFAEDFFAEPFDYLDDGIFDGDSRKLFIGALDLDVELSVGRGWRRAGDTAPKKFFHARFKTLRRAFQICRRTFSLGSVAHDD